MIGQVKGKGFTGVNCFCQPLPRFLDLISRKQRLEARLQEEDVLVEMKMIGQVQGKVLSGVNRSRQHFLESPNQKQETGAMMSGVTVPTYLIVVFTSPTICSCVYIVR